jgi:hypothetical protein
MTFSSRWRSSSDLRALLPSFERGLEVIKSCTRALAWPKIYGIVPEHRVSSPGANADFQRRGGCVA